MSCIFNKLFGWLYRNPSDVEDILSFYEKKGWHNYPGNKELLEELFSDYKPESFVPYFYYNKDMDVLDIYFKEDLSYTSLLNKDLNLFLSQETDEIVGVSVLNIKRLVSNS